MNSATPQSTMYVWLEHADKLASWTLRYLVNRTDVFGQYYHVNPDLVLPGGVIPVKQRTVREELTLDILQQHFKALSAEEVVGIYSISPDDTCRWIEIDIDQHSGKNDEVGERNLFAARHWYSVLKEIGFEPLLWHSNGRGGFRLNVRFETPIACSEANSFGLWLVRDWKEFGLPSIPEVFPKQRSVEDTKKKLGNFVRLPGRHPKRNFYPEVFDGLRWLRGEAAVNHILQLTAQSSSLIPVEALEYVPPKQKSVARVGTGFLVPVAGEGESLSGRANALMAGWRLPSVGDRNSTLFRAGCVLGERLPLSRDEHLAALRDFNARFPEPLSDSEVSSIATSSYNKTESRRGLIVYSPAMVEEILPLDPGGAVSLEQYRKLLADKYGTLQGQPGIYLDTTQVGVGKTYQGVKLAGKLLSSLHVIPTHRTKDDLVKQLVQDGELPSTEVASFPERTADNCQRMDEVNRQYKYAIVVPSALCSTCEYRTGCPHLAARELAEKARHSVGTMARMENASLARIGANKELIRIDEDSINLLRPKEKASVQVVSRFLGALEAAISFVERNRHASHDREGDSETLTCLAFLRQMKRTGEKLVSNATFANADMEVSIGCRVAAPKNLEFLLKKGFELSGIESKSGELGRAKKVLVGLVSGELQRCVIQVTKDCKERSVKAVVGVWQTELPRKADCSFTAPILFSDATADKELLETVLGLPIIDITPKAFVANQRRVFQVPLDVKRNTAKEQFFKILRGLLVRFPDKKRVGVIGHRPHIEVLAELGNAFRSRIVKSSYFGSGEDRASNEWLDEKLDLLLVIGTPRIPVADVRSRMIQLGLDSTASESTWKKRYWRGRTGSGESIDIITLRYSDPSWQRAYQYDVQSSLKQALGRARSALPEGIDAIVVTCEPLSLPIWDETLIEVPDRIDNAIELLLGRGCSHGFPLWKLLAEELALKERAAKDLLKELCELGVVVKLKRNKYELSEVWRSVDSLTELVVAAPLAP